MHDDQSPERPVVAANRDGGFMPVRGSLTSSRAWESLYGGLQAQPVRTGGTTGPCLHIADLVHAVGPGNAAQF